MIDARTAHIANEYYIKMTNNQEQDICVVDMPLNIIIEAPEMTTIYEMDDKSVSIYRNKEKFLTQECPNYAKRVLVWAHILKLVDARELANTPVVVEQFTKNIVECDSLMTIEPVFSLLKEPDSHTDTELEIKLLTFIGDSTKFSRTKEIPKDIVEGFTVCMKIFRGD